MTLGGCIGLSLVLLLVGGLAGLRRPRLWLAFTLGGTAALLAAAFWTLGSGVAWEWRSAWPMGGERVHLRLDGVSAWFLTLVAVVGGTGAVYARGYWPEQAQPESAGRGRAWWSVLVLSMTLVLLCSNGLHFLMAWEAFALAGYFLIALDRGRRETRAAGWLYLGASHAGTLGLFAFFSMLAARTGSWELGPMRGAFELAPLFWVALFGFGVKAGLFPLHIWLPSAHANAPSHVSAILSGVAIKMGLYGLVRFSGWLPLPRGAGWVVLGLGVASALMGAAFALAQNDLKRLLAYCSVENMGVMLIGLGAALIGFADGGAGWGWGRVAMAGALLHAWNHGLFKSLLFFGAGSVLHATGTREMSRLGGLWRAMPWTAGLFAYGAVAICALPPLNGFVSEWLLYLGLFESVAGHGPVASFGAIIALGVTGALALAAFVKAGAVVFLGAGRTRATQAAHECGWWMRGPMLVLAGLCAGIGVVPMVSWWFLTRSLASWEPGWGGMESSPPLATLGRLHVGLALAFALAAVALWRRARANGMRRELTWDCGYSAPSTRMQYTGGSFAAIASGWFRWVLRPERRMRRPRGLFPTRSSRVERVPETVLERVLGPAGGVVMAASAWVRQRQRGHLPDYILYLVAGLAGVGALVLAGIW